MDGTLLNKKYKIVERLTALEEEGGDVDERVTALEGEVDAMDTTVDSLDEQRNQVNYVRATIVDISSYSSSYYTCPSDGYIRLTTGSVLLADGEAVIMTSDGTVQKVLFVKKGMKLKCTATGGSNDAKFIPLAAPVAP